MKQAFEPMVVFLNVGQGDAILIQEDTFQILVDTGPDDSLIYELPKYMPEHDRTIEVVLLTHSHDDHIQGLFSLSKQYDIQTILFDSRCFKSATVSENFADKLVSISAPYSIRYKDIDFSIIYPFVSSTCHSDVNQDSIVSSLKVADVNVLFMGDAGFEAEQSLLEESKFPEIDILKTGHHCSRTATSDMFLSQIFPETAICSCGESNSFGHPHSETIEKFEKYNVQYLITYQKGNIVFKFKKQS